MDICCRLSNFSAMKIENKFSQLEKITANLKSRQCDLFTFLKHNIIVLLFFSGMRLSQSCDGVAPFRPPPLIKEKEVLELCLELALRETQL